MIKKKQLNQPNNKSSYLFYYLLLLTGLFLLLEISFFTTNSDFYLRDINVVANHLKIPFKVIPPLLFFISIQLVIHLLFTFIVWAQARLVGIALKYSPDKTEKFGIGLWVLSVLTVIFANQCFYPNSIFSELTEVLFNQSVAGFLLLFFILLLSVAFIVAFAGLLKVLTLRMYVAIFPFFLVAGLVVHYSSHSQVMITDASSIDRPNIIFIGIDSLRPDFLGYFGYAKNTPHLDRFLNRSTVFAQSLTPIARTFPSWVSILTGQYPKQSGVRTNLQDHLSVNFTSTLPALLREQGYEAIFATDETRFSNIDQRFGFDRIIVPGIGFNDFLIGTLNDFPFSNLLVNTALGKWIFPYSYGNRPVSSTYDPNSFLALLQPTLERPRSKPLFLAVHFCLPHMPYYWGTKLSNDKSINNYRNAIHRVDQQFNDFVQMLEKTKLLEHSIVVVLSDHGEAIELQGDRVTAPDLFIPGKQNQKGVIPHFYPPSVNDEPVDVSAGHGTDVLGITQYHTVLAFRLFGLDENKQTVVSDLVSLLDIKPTILGLLGLNTTNETGKSLGNIILGKKTIALSPKHFFTESDFTPMAIRTVHPEMRQTLFEGIDYFQIDPVTTRFSVKKSMESLILSSKQFADFYGDWVLGLYPQSETTMELILVNLKTGAWTNDMTTQFAQQSPANLMLQALRDFYGSDLKSYIVTS